MLTNTPATLYNYYKDRVTKKEIYLKTVLETVFWDNSKQSNILKSGLSTVDDATVYVLFSVGTGGKKYIDARGWAKTSAELLSKYFTFQLNSKDILVKGVCSYEFSDENPIKELIGTHDTIVIANIDAKDFGSNHMRHWQIGGK